MRGELLQLAAELSRRGEPFVLAVVVRREPASSAQPGDMAVITGDGVYHGWVGGACAAPSVRREAERVLADGEPRLLSLGPEPAAAGRPGMLALPITCHSGGTVEIFLEPVVPAPRVRVYGGSPAARALARLARAMGYGAERFGPASPADGELDAAAGEVSSPAASAPCPEPLCAVVATMGDEDEDALAAALASRPAYVGVVASRRRFAGVRESLLGRGVAAEALDAVHNPAGLDLGARRPEEIAVSILAEIVKLRPAATRAREAAPAAEVAQPATVIDPICGMTVTLAGARHRVELDGVVHAFCCARCRERFLAARAGAATEGAAGGPA